MTIYPGVITNWPIVYTVRSSIFKNKVNKLLGNKVYTLDEKPKSPSSHIGTIFKSAGTITGNAENLQAAESIITIAAINNHPK